MVNLKRKAAIVTGASRGVGKGIALGLGEAGATVYVTGRTMEDKTDAGNLGGTVSATAEAVTAIGGQGIGIQCDHRDDAQTEVAFQQVAKVSKKIDILVNNAGAGYENMHKGRRFTYFKPFWEQPFWRWDAMFVAGVRAAFTASAHAARLMTKKKSGLIVNISYWSAQVYMSNSESPQFIGRVAAALVADPAIMKKTGKVLVAALEALEYSIQDIDGKQPRPLSLEDF